MNIAQTTTTTTTTMMMMMTDPNLMPSVAEENATGVMRCDKTRLQYTLLHYSIHTIYTITTILYDTIPYYQSISLIHGMPLLAVLIIRQK